MTHNRHDYDDARTETIIGKDGKAQAAKANPYSSRCFAMTSKAVLAAPLARCSTTCGRLVPSTYSLSRLSSLPSSSSIGGISDPIQSTTC